MTGEKIPFINWCRDNGLLCWICGGEIIYEEDPNRHRTGDRSFSRDHYWPVSLRPDLQDIRTNWRASHKLCNNRRGSRTPNETIWIGDIYWGRWADETETDRARRLFREAKKRPHLKVYE